MWRRILFIVVGAALFLYPLCARGQAPIKLGFLGGLSGPHATIGGRAQKGVEFAISEINEKGGINGQKLQLVSIDDESDPSKSVIGFKRLVSRESVTAIISASGTGPTIAITEAGKEYQVPTIVTIGSGMAVMRAKNPYFFRIRNNDSHQVAKCVAWIRKNGYERVAFLHDSSGHGLTARSLILSVLKKEGFEPVVVETVKVGSMDMTPQALKIQQAKADVILYWGLGTDAVTLCKTLKQLNMPQKIIGNDGMTQEAVLNIGADVVEGRLYGCSATQRSKPKFKQFEAAYLKKFGLGPNTEIRTEAQGYDGIKFLEEGLRRAKGRGGEELMLTLESIKNFEIVTGREGATISFGPGDRDGQKSFDMGLVLYTVKNKRWFEILD
jgi:branched-chain amino acid transport system substrate-binding protein